MAIVKLPLTSLMKPELEVYKYQISRALLKYGLMNLPIADYRILVEPEQIKISIFIDRPPDMYLCHYVREEVVIFLDKEEGFVESDHYRHTSEDFEWR